MKLRAVLALGLGLVAGIVLPTSAQLPLQHGHAAPLCDAPSGCRHASGARDRGDRDACGSRPGPAGVHHRDGRVPANDDADRDRRSPGWGSIVNLSARGGAAMAKNASPKRAPQRAPGPPDAPQQAPDPSSTPDEAEQGQRRYVYKRRTQPSMTRRTKTTLIDREGRSVPGPTGGSAKKRVIFQMGQHVFAQHRGSRLCRAVVCPRGGHDREGLCVVVSANSKLLARPF